MQDRTTESESLLVRNLSKGNLLAFNTLYKEYSGRLYRFALGYLKSEAEAEELVQEVFTLIWENRATLKEELSFKSFRHNNKESFSLRLQCLSFSFI